MKEKENQKLIDSYDYLSNAASTHDCTGLIPPRRSVKRNLNLMRMSIITVLPG